VEKEIQKEIEDIINGLKCRRDFICYKSGFQQLCKVRDIELENFLICLDGHNGDCKFSVYFSESHFCQCPLRIREGKESTERQGDRDDDHVHAIASFRNRLSTKKIKLSIGL
jgi:hypothetical protein